MPPAAQLWQGHPGHSPERRTRERLHPGSGQKVRPMGLSKSIGKLSPFCSFLLCPFPTQMLSYLKYIWSSGQREVAVGLLGYKASPSPRSAQRQEVCRSPKAIQSPALGSRVVVAGQLTLTEVCSTTDTSGVFSTRQVC